MADRFDKFTERARRVLTLAQEEAQRFNHEYIGTEHLLLGLIREGDSTAAQVLQNLGVSLSKVRTAVEFIIGRGDRRRHGEIGLTPRAKKVIELSVEEARRLKHTYIGTEHLLIGLMREGEGIAFGVLESLGVNLERVRTATRAILANSAPETEQMAAEDESIPELILGESQEAGSRWIGESDYGRAGHIYMVDSQWAGWWGGFGAEQALNSLLNERAREGWRLVRSEQAVFLWCWFIPRRRLLLFWERPI